MGEVARACREEGGEILGVITSHLAALEVAFDGCDDLVVVGSMRERKKIMVDEGDAFVVLPGGLGTYEELFETLVGRVLSEHDKPIAILNDHGYFDPLVSMIDHGIEHRFIRQAAGDLLTVHTDPTEIIDAILSDQGHGHQPSDLIPPLSSPRE